MTRTYNVLLVIGLTAFGVWGCQRGSQPQQVSDRTRQLEARVAKLEEDLLSVVAARDTLQSKLAAADTAARTAADRATAAERERDAVAARLKAKTAERDQLAAQFDGFRSNLRELLGRTDAALAPPSAAGVPATPASLSK